MNDLQQLENGIIGSKKAADALAAKKEAHILLISDSHGRKIIDFILERFGKDVDAVVFTGDGAGDFIGCLDRAETDISFMQSVPAVAVLVMGNNDAGAYRSFAFRVLRIPKSVLFTAAGKKIYAVHGHLQGVYSDTKILEAEAHMMGADIAVFGHTHYPEERRGKVYLVNAGSCALPRYGSPQSLALITITQRETNAVFYRIDMKRGLEFTPYIPEGMGQNNEEVGMSNA
ncbi:MAG: metallophosphoesterase family protein [Treponema sp.]